MSAIWTVTGTGEAAGIDLGITLATTPAAHDALDVDAWDDEDNRVELTIDRDEALSLRDALTTWLGDQPQSGNPA